MTIIDGWDKEVEKTLREMKATYGCALALKCVDGVYTLDVMYIDDNGELHADWDVYVCNHEGGSKYGIMIEIRKSMSEHYAFRRTA